MSAPLDPSKVKAGDTVTLEDRRNGTHDSSITPDPDWRLTGTVREVHVTHSRDGAPYAWSVRIGHTPYWMGMADWTYTLTDHQPAPLDPKLVHVGDTVTVRFKATGEEFTTKAYQPEDITKPGEWVYILGWPLNKPMGHGLAFSYFEILAIEPAPEPEPEYEEDKVYAISTSDIKDGYATYLPDMDLERYPWMSLTGARFATDVVTDTRPLVVIDPAAVDVDALARHNGLRAEPLRGVLRDLGIEVA